MAHFAREKEGQFEILFVLDRSLLPFVERTRGQPRV
jgi:hypothetical protein